MPTQAPTHFFISYTSSDLSWAEWIAWELKEYGHKVTLAAWHFTPGRNWPQEMQKALTAADKILAVLSQEYFKAIYTQLEWTVGIVGPEPRLMPVRVKECELEGMWKTIIYADLVNLSEEQCRRALRRALIQGAPPPIRPPFPGPFPGTLPAIWNIPYERNSKFRDREDYLADLHTTLTSTGASARAQAIVGPGGIGKTEIAIEYAYRHHEDYNKLVWWLRTAELAADYESLARALYGSEGKFGDHAAIVQSVQDWLNQNSNWLLIFDDAQNQVDLRPYFPSKNRGHVLITSRNQNWQGMANVIKVGPFELGIATDFLLPEKEAA